MPRPAKMTYKLACLYKCHNCMGEYFDGKIDCEMVSCPNYSFMPYRELEPDLSCFDYNPKRTGQQGWGEARTLSQEHIDKMQEARKNPKPKKKKIVKPIEFKKVVKKRKKNNG